MSACRDFQLPLRGAFAAALILCGSVPFAAQAGALEDRSAAREIGRLEALYSQGFVTGDPRAAETLLAEDFLGFGPRGERWSKRDMLADVRRLPHQVSARITSVDVRLLGDTAVALGTEEDVSPRTRAVERRIWLDTWRRTPKGWRMAASAEGARNP